jgi:hypothetical protein
MSDATRSLATPEQEIADLLRRVRDLEGKSLSRATKTYSPTWTAATTNPVIGNGSISGRYQVVDKMVIGFFKILMGSTTTFGSGEYRVSPPLAHASGYEDIPIFGGLTIHNPGVARHHIVLKYFPSLFRLGGSNPGAQTVWDATTPITLDADCQVMGTFFYIAN